MNTLTQHVEQLAKEVEPAPCERPCDHIRCQAARLMTAMAKFIEAHEATERPGHTAEYLNRKFTARRELDALVKGTQ